MKIPIDGFIVINVRLAGEACCWTDMLKGWTVNFARVSCLTSILFGLGCSEPGPLAKADAEAQRLDVAPTPPADRKVGLFGAAFQIPAECTIDCVSCIWPPQGGLRCWDPSGSQDQSGAFTVGEEPTLEPHAPTSQGRQEVGTAMVYWGEVPDGSRYCAVVTRPEHDATPKLYWHFCTGSSDLTVRALLRGIALSVQDDAQNLTPTPCRNDV